MKKLLLVCAFVLGVSALSFAQGGGGQGGQGGGGGRGRRTPEQQVTRLKEQLTLTDAQVTKITAIYTAQAKVQDSLRTANAAGGGGGDQAAQRTARTAMTKAVNDKVLALLTPEQATIFKKQLEDQAKAQAARQNGN